MSRQIAPFLGERRGCVVAGPHAVAFVADDDPVRHAVITRLVERATDPVDVVEQAERLLGDAERSHPPCVVVGLPVPGESGDLTAVVHGDPGVSVHEVAPPSSRRLASADGVPLRTTVESSAVLVAGAAPASLLDDSVDRLAAGTLAADGFSLSPADSAMSATAPEVAERPVDADSADADSVDADSADADARIDRWSAPVPPAGPPSVPDAARRLSVLGGRTAEPPTVDGIMCSRGHFNDPRARFCGSCGIAMHHASIVMVRRPRPTLGQLVFDTGETFQIATDVVVGRNAGDDSLVAGGDARSLVPSGDTSALSRAHAEIRVDGWDVVLTDRNSLNGTFVWERATQRWRRLDPGSGETLRIGDVVAFGRRTATFESSVRPA